MKVEVDQSGKVGQKSVATALAYANGKEKSILVSKQTKRRVIKELRQRGKGDTLYHLFFATLLYFLLKDEIESFTQIVIDIEYRNKNNMIREHLLNLLRRVGKQVPASQIQFTLITKNSPARRVAVQTLRGQRKPDHEMTFSEIIKEFPVE